MRFTIIFYGNINGIQGADRPYYIYDSVEQTIKKISFYTLQSLIMQYGISAFTNYDRLRVGCVFGQVGIYTEDLAVVRMGVTMGVAWKGLVHKLQNPFLNDAYGLRFGIKDNVFSVRVYADESELIGLHFSEKHMSNGFGDDELGSYTGDARTALARYMV